MKKFFYTLLFSCLLLPVCLFSQIIIDGNLKMGDSSQVLALKTIGGDQMVGSILKWDTDSLTFKMNTGDLHHLNLTEISGIEIKEDLLFEATSDLGQGSLIFYTDEGETIEGHIINMNLQGLRMIGNDKKRKYLPTGEVEKIVYDPTAQANEQNYLYLLRLRNAEDVFGHLLYLNDQSVIFRPLGEKTYNFPRSMVNALHRRKSPPEMTGHQRALFLTPTGFNLRKGQSEFRNINYILNSYSTGFNDHFSGTIGLLGIEPYVQLKTSYDLSQYIHLSVGVGASLAGGLGWQTAASIGIPDHYLNLGYMRNKGETSFSETDMNAIFFGGSTRIDSRHRFFAEFTHIIEKEDLFETNGYGTNTFALGLGWFGNRFSVNFSLLLAERIFSDFCFNGVTFIPCNDEAYEYIPIPVISTSIFFEQSAKQ